MTCQCTKNRIRLALLADQSSGENLPEDVRRCLANCPTCREHYDHLCHAMDCLHKTQAENTALLEKSLWTDLTHRLPESQVQQPHNSHWKQKVVPIFSVTTACIALMVVFLGEAPSNNRMYQTAINRSTNSLPIPSLSVDYPQQQYQNLIAPGIQIDPLMNQPLYLNYGSPFPLGITPGTARDFSYPAELQLKEFLELQRQLDSFE
ncbi:MAG: hypothetical protein JKY95_00765 [Planctomycetaceae bacterium]|nr:hypothetical protein [Planctomycetaceae bacterium]